MQDVIINKTNENIDILVLENGILAEMYCYTPDTNSILGNIYMGKVVDVVNGMQAAFLDIGINRNAFISVKDAMKKVDITKEAQDTNVKMSDILKIGQNILVQVKKEPVDEKGARVSTHITFPGKYVVLMPGTDIITISQKIINESEKERLIKIVRSLLPENFGAIVRTDAEGIAEKLISEDILKLLKKWDGIIAESQQTSDVRLIYNDHHIAERVLRDIVGQKTNKIYINDKKLYDEVIKDSNDSRIVFEDTDLISKFGLETEFSKAHNRKVYLNCGAHIVIDKAEALTAIDVNSGKFTGTKDLESTTLKVNLEAAKEIMRQIRLKDVGGIIVIDFIDMHVEAHKEEVLELMKKEAIKDRSKVDVKEFTKLNLVELTRKKLYV